MNGNKLRNRGRKKYSGVILYSISRMLTKRSQIMLTTKTLLAMMALTLLPAGAANTPPVLLPQQAAIYELQARVYVKVLIEHVRTLAKEGYYKRKTSISIKSP